jgi:glycerol kinase
VISGALRNGNLQTSDLVSVGITNQRETTLLWDRKTGKPLHRVWRDTRTDQLVAQFGNEGGQDRLRPKTGCRSRHISPPQAALAAAQRSWARDKAAADDAPFGNMGRLVGVEPDRRNQGWEPPDGRNQRVAHAIDGSGNPQIGF